MEAQHITIVTKAHDGKVSIHTEVPVADDDTYVVTIAVTPQPHALDDLYGALADSPMPEVTIWDKRSSDWRCCACP